jgi:tRNA(Ile)-lysidine synthase
MKKKIANRSGASQSEPAALPFDSDLFCAGDRVCAAVSGGADSIALLRALLDQREELGIVLSVIHVNHGLRGVTAEEDAKFVAALAERFGLPCEVVAVNTAKRAEENKETIEEAARHLRYEAFREALNSGMADKIATAHTLDDQAETVLMKLLRGAWTEGMSGIHPTLRLTEAPDNLSDVRWDCVRPLLAVRREQIEAYLYALGQSWREDASNCSLAHTRNRVRHELLPSLRQYNPQIDGMLAQMAANARAEEQHWQAELGRVLPHLLLPGKPVRGGGRSVDTRPGYAAVALDLGRVAALDLGLRRRVLRAAAKECGATLDFAATERLLQMADPRRRGSNSKSSKHLELPNGVRVVRSARELQFERRSSPALPVSKSVNSVVPYPGVEPAVYELAVPGSVEASAFGVRFTVELIESEGWQGKAPVLQIRAWRPGDRVELRHSKGAKKVKELLERMGLRGEDRKRWPVAVCGDQIVWMRGVDILQTPLGGPFNPGNHDKRNVFNIQETSIDVEGSGEGKFPAAGWLGVE